MPIEEIIDFQPCSTTLNSSLKTLDKLRRLPYTIDSALKAIERHWMRIYSLLADSYGLAFNFVQWRSTAYFKHADILEYSIQLP